MKITGLFLLALSLVGCSSPSRYASDPRAGVVGHAFLDYMAEFPRDRDTEYFYPSFTSGGSPAAPLQVFPGSGVPLSVAALLIDIPQPNPNVDGCAGKGFPALERSGIRLCTASAK